MLLIWGMKSAVKTYINAIIYILCNIVTSLL